MIGLSIDIASPDKIREKLKNHPNMVLRMAYSEFRDLFHEACIPLKLKGSQPSYNVPVAVVIPRYLEDHVVMVGQVVTLRDVSAMENPDAGFSKDRREEISLPAGTLRSWFEDMCIVAGGCKDDFFCPRGLRLKTDGTITDPLFYFEYGLDADGETDILAPPRSPLQSMELFDYLIPPEEAPQQQLDGEKIDRNQEMVDLIQGGGIPTSSGN